jgi:hypothetical protein
MHIIPFKPSNPHCEFQTLLDGQIVTFEQRWNAADNDGDGAWYFNLRTGDGVVLSRSNKVVLGPALGRRIEHPLTRGGCIVARDLSGQGREAGFDDLGVRVIVMYFTNFEMVNELMRQS